MLIPDAKKLELFEVDLWTGEFVAIKTDLYVFDTIPLAFTRVARSVDDWSKRHRIFLRHVYDPYLFMDRNPYTSAQWLLPDNVHIRYSRISSGTRYSDALYEFDGLLPSFEGSQLNWNGDGWDLTLEDGTTYLSPEAYNAENPQQGSLVGIFDREGSEVRLSRQKNGDLTEIRSPNGKWIRLKYDQGKISEARDSLGNTAYYDYDLEDRLHVVQYPDAGTVYQYDALSQIIDVQDGRGTSLLESRYDSEGRVVQQRLSNGETYFLRYGPMEEGMNRWAEISGPQIGLTRITLSGTDYSILEHKRTSD